MDPLTVMAITKGAGAVFGAIQSAKGAIKKGQAEKLAPGLADPNRVRDLEVARRKQAQLDSGTDTTTQEALKSNRQSTRATQRDLAKSTGGNAQGTVSALLQAQRLGGNINNKAFAGAAQRGLVMNNFSNTIAKEVSQRKLDLQQFRSVQRRAEGARLAKEGFGNTMGSAFSAIGSKAGGGGQPQEQAGSTGAFDSLSPKSLGFGSPDSRLAKEGSLDAEAFNLAAPGGAISQ